MSPELLDPERFGFKDSQPTKESDCYALGMVVYEVLSSQAPFTQLKDYMVTLKVTNGERPARPGGVEGTWFTDDLWETLKLCWATGPEIRPNIEAVLERLGLVSRAWKPPPPPQADEDVESEDDWDLTAIRDSL